VETAEWMSKMAGQTTVVKKQVSTSGKRFGMTLDQVSESYHEVQRPLMTADEIMRLPGPKKDATGDIIEAGEMLVFVAGQPVIRGTQLLYFQDPVFSKRSKTPPPEQSDHLHQNDPPEEDDMAINLKSIGCAAVLAAASVSGCDRAEMDKHASQYPRPPIKIPLPLDKAGGKVDITFEIPPSTNGNRSSPSYFVGMRVLFTPGTSDVRRALEKHPISARIFLYRIENGKEIQVPLRSSNIRHLPPVGPLSNDNAIELPDGVAFATSSHVQHTSDPIGTPNASTFVLRFASARTSNWPGVYRLQFEMLEDIPELSGLTSFFVYETRRRR